MSETTPAPTGPKTAEKYTPLELAKLTGNAKPADPSLRFGQAPPPKDAVAFSWQHAAAAQLHGWESHAHHANEPFKMTIEAYEGALKAAAEPVTRLVGKDGKPGSIIEADALAKLNGTKPVVHAYEPHKAALSEHCPHAKEAK